MEANPCVSDTPSGDVSDPVEAVTELFPSCAVTRAMAKANAGKDDKPGDDKLTSAESIGEIQDSTFQSARTDATCISMENQAVSEFRKSVKNVIFTLQKVIVDQEKDQEICKLNHRALNEREATKIPVCYFIENGILLRKWQPPDVAASHEWKVISNCSTTGVSTRYFGFSSLEPLAGHLGIIKTYYYKVLNNFYWPGLRDDIKQYCKTCHNCQLVEKLNKKPPVAPHKPIPVMEEPFSHIIVDCEGPLPKTCSGYQYCLNVMCASTCFPEAIPLRSVKAWCIVKTLVKFFTFVGYQKLSSLTKVLILCLACFSIYYFSWEFNRLSQQHITPTIAGDTQAVSSNSKNMMKAYFTTEGRTRTKRFHFCCLLLGKNISEIQSL